MQGLHLAIVAFAGVSLPVADILQRY